MRSSTQIFNLVINTAEKDERIRAVILNGSRANPAVKADRFQDYDVVYIVTALESFTVNHDWIAVFGERLILQMPDQMLIPQDAHTDKTSFAYLMLFKDGNRIDLTLYPQNNLQNFNPGSLTKVLLDKDNRFLQLDKPSNKDYLIKKPTEKEFLDCCNEFWWVSTYIAKGLARNEITYAKYMLENPVRNMFMQLLEWDTGIKTGYTISFGQHGKYAGQHIDPELWKRILTTYPSEENERIWDSLFSMTAIFSETANHIARQLNFTYNNAEEKNVLNYLHEVKSL